MTALSVRRALPRFLSLAIAAVALTTAQSRAEERKLAGASSAPAGAPLVMKITGKMTYEFDADEAERAREYEEALNDPKKGAAWKAGVPPPPRVEWTLEIANTSEKPVWFYGGGDAMTLTVELRGDGALTLPGVSGHTEEHRMPIQVQIAPGDVYKRPLSLTSGFRGNSKVAYWTQPGEYTVVATLSTALKPPMKGENLDEHGFSSVVLTSAEMVVTVVKPEDK